MAAKTMGLAPTGANPIPVVRLRGITKEYDTVRVLHGVDFDLRAGEVHALLGGNGAGKSTLIKCMAGAEQPSAGEIYVDERLVAFASPADGIAVGIAVVYQELSLFPPLSVAENLLGRKGTGGIVRWREMHRQARHYLSLLGIDLDPWARIDELAVAEQQMVEIARALFSSARVIVLDEPTSALSEIEKDILFGFVKQMTERGVAFVLVTHTLEDALERADRITVLRDGRLVFSGGAGDTDRAGLVSKIVGQERHDLARSMSGAVTLKPPSTKEVLLRANAVTRLPTVRGMSFDVREGEVVALYGHPGSGHVEVGELLFGLVRPTTGTVEVRGGTTVISSATQAREAGIGFIPMDRRDGLALEQSVARNVTLARLHKLQGIFLRGREEDRLVERMIDQLKIVGARPKKAVGQLSGGNQQKALFARWLVGKRPDVLILVEPTRGMDVAAKAAVLEVVRELADAGAGVIVISAEPETVLAAADRILVANNGKIVANLAGTTVTEELLMEKAS